MTSQYRARSVFPVLLAPGSAHPNRPGEVFLSHIVRILQVGQGPGDPEERMDGPGRPIVPSAEAATAWSSQYAPSAATAVAASGLAISQATS